MSYKKILNEGNDFIRRYKEMLVDGKVSETPVKGVSHEEANLWYAKVEQLIINQNQGNTDIIENWITLKESLPSHIDEAIRRDWPVLEGYRNHISKCLAFIHSHTKEPSWFNNFIRLILLFKPTFINKTIGFIIFVGMSIIVDSIFDQILSGFLEQYFDVKLDNTHPMYGIALVAMALMFLYFSNKNSEKTI